MHFLIDADLPRAAGPLLSDAGYDATDVRDVGLGHSPDIQIAGYARAHQLCLLTGDFGFADIRSHPPDQYMGIVVFELPRKATEQTILQLIEILLGSTDVLAKLPGRLAIVSFKGIRLRPA